MATLTIRNLDESIKRRIRVRAAEHGVSMEEEARSILRTAVTDTETYIFEAKSSSELVQPRGEWHLNVSLEELMRLSVKPEKPFDQKAVSDELYDYMDGM